VLLASIEETGNYSPEQLQQFRIELGLADPIHIQFVKWTSGVLRGNLATASDRSTDVEPLLVCGERQY
jgi:ABC-type dipeptide/oligopeptide/nickel transport system permease component